MSDKKYFSDCACKQVVNHIDCEVKNCRYHAENNCCLADVIQVTPSYASKETDTACSTFESID